MPLLALPHGRPWLLQIFSIDSVSRDEKNLVLLHIQRLIQRDLIINPTRRCMRCLHERKVENSELDDYIFSVKRSVSKRTNLLYLIQSGRIRQFSLLISSCSIPKSSYIFAKHKITKDDSCNWSESCKREVKGRVRVLCNTLDAFKSQNRFGSMGIKVQTG